ncbi:MAG: cycloisomerase [Rhodobacteraceae bacterium]|nr:cycloisomerase [Paracoccaceae bacterium]
MSEHRISEMTVHVVRMPVKEVHSHGSGDVSAINSVLLELTTESGITGWGEASPWPAFTGIVEASAAALHVHLRDLVIGADPVKVEVIMTQVERQLVGNPEAKSALECALLDVTGQICGFSISELLGGQQRAVIPLSFSVANRDFARDIDCVQSLWDDGIRLFKVKAGFDAHSFDLMRLTKLRSLYGDEIQLRVDYNQGLPAVDAVRRIRDLESFALDFVEQPVQRHEVSVMADIAHAVAVPIMADESVFTPFDALHGATIRMADIYSLKINKSGGMRRSHEIAAIARAAGIDIYGGCMFETSIAHAAGTHMLAALPGLRLGCEFYMSSYYAEADLAETEFPVKNGFVHVPTGPGLGIRPARDKLERYRCEMLK